MAPSDVGLLYQRGAILRLALLASHWTDARFDRGLRKEVGEMKERPAYWTFDERAYAEFGYRLYYFAPTNRARPPYRTQLHVEAIIDIADDGTLAGVELIDDRMPPPPKETP